MVRSLVNEVRFEFSQEAKVRDERIDIGIFTLSGSLAMNGGADSSERVPPVHLEVKCRGVRVMQSHRGLARLCKLKALLKLLYAEFQGGDITTGYV